MKKSFIDLLVDSVNEFLREKNISGENIFDIPEEKTQSNVSYYLRAMIKGGPENHLFLRLAGNYNELSIDFLTTFPKNAHDDNNVIWSFFCMNYIDGTSDYRRAQIRERGEGEVQLFGQQFSYIQSMRNIIIQKMMQRDIYSYCEEDTFEKEEEI